MRIAAFLFFALEAKRPLSSLCRIEPISMQFSRFESPNRHDPDDHVIDSLFAPRKRYRDQHQACDQERKNNCATQGVALLVGTGARCLSVGNHNIRHDPWESPDNIAY